MRPAVEEVDAKPHPRHLGYGWVQETTGSAWGRVCVCDVQRPDPQEDWSGDSAKPLPRAGAAWEDLPGALQDIRRAIEDSRGILELETDVECGEVEYSEETWQRACQFLSKNAKWLWDSYGCVIDAPRVLPGPSGSIDLHWDFPSYEMLINIPSQAASRAGFYGDDRGSISIKGTIDPGASKQPLFLWLARVT